MIVILWQSVMPMKAGLVVWFPPLLAWCLLFLLHLGPICLRSRSHDACLVSNYFETDEADCMNLEKQGRRFQITFDKGRALSVSDGKAKYQPVLRCPVDLYIAAEGWPSEQLFWGG